MTSSYRCPIHQTMQTAACQPCMEDFRTRRDASEMTPEERATALENITPILTIPFSDLHQRIEELAGRSVFTHELGTGGLERLAAEVRSGQAATMADVMEKIPSDKRVIVVQTD
jgi:hypothetical protein